MSSEDRGRSSYLDLLVTTLMEPEKNLDSLIEKLEKISENLSSLHAEGEKTTVKKELSKTETPDQGTIIFMKIKLDHQRDDIVKIIESLKE